jgi:predicted metal-dependent peptidase
MKEMMLFDKDALEHRLSDVLDQYPFFSCVSRYVSRVIDESVETTSVEFSSETMSYKIKCNPHFFSKLSLNEQCGVIQHELYHVALDHVGSERLSWYMKTDSSRAGLMTDCAVNSLIASCATVTDYLPSQAVIPGVTIDLPKLLSAEDYWERIPGSKKLKKKEDGNEKVSGDKHKEEDEFGELDDHSSWDKMSSAERSLARSVSQSIREAALDTVKVLGWGKGSADTCKSIALADHVSTDWSILEEFIGKIRSPLSHATYSRLSRKVKDFPGRKRQRTCKVLVAIDESGSVRNAQLSAVYAVLQQLNVEADICRFDTVATKPEQWVKDVDVKRKKCSGTNLDAPLIWIMEDTDMWQALLIVTDGQAPFPSECPIPRLWLKVPGSDFDFGEATLTIEKDC